MEKFEHVFQKNNISPLDVPEDDIYINNVSLLEKERDEEISKYIDNYGFPENAGCTFQYINDSFEESEKYEYISLLERYILNNNFDFKIKVGMFEAEKIRGSWYSNHEKILNLVLFLQNIGNKVFISSKITGYKGKSFSYEYENDNLYVFAPLGECENEEEFFHYEKTLKKILYHFSQGYSIADLIQ